jgi:SAM-dependent methyltransferase
VTDSAAEARALARLYDVDLAEDPGDVDLYLALARRTGGPVLELGVGTGRIATELARVGVDVTGIDLEAAMLERAGARLEAAGSTVAARVRLVEGDMVDVRLPDAGTFRLAFIALNTVFVLGTRDRQRAAIATLAAHLAPGGLAVIDIWLPDIEDLARFDGRLIFEYERQDPDTGRTVTKFAAARHDSALGVVDLTSIYEEGEIGGPVIRWIRRDALRLVSADELRSLAADAGLVVEQLAGSYELDPLAPGSERAIVVAARP